MQFSKNTLKLLKVFYSHPDQEYYMQQLGRILKKKPGVFQRALYNLEKQGVLESYYRANARFFGANKNYSMYKELKSIVHKTGNLIVIVTAAFLFLSGAGVGFCAEDKPQELELTSLKDAVAIAYRNNKDVKFQEYGLKVSSADILGARSAFLPMLDLNAAYIRNGAVLNPSGTTASGKDVGVFSGYKNDNLANVTLTDTIYNGGANISVLRQAQLALKAQEETLRATKLNVEFEAKRLYYGLLLAYETKQIAEDLLRQAQEHYEQVNNKYKQGTSSRFDVLQSKVQASLLEPQLINAQNSIDLIIAQMDKLLGLKVQGKIIVKDKLAYAPLEIKEAEFLKEAYMNEPEMILKALGIDISKWAVKYAKAGWLPQVGANAEYLYRAGDLKDMFSNKHNNWSAGFSFSVPIFDGFSTRAKVDAAKAKYMQSVIDRENLSDQVAVDVRQACLDLKEQAAIIKSQEDNLQDAADALRISYVRYNNGVGVNLDVLDAQVALAQVRKNLIEGIYDYIMAKAKLDRTMGRSVVEEAKK